MRRILSLVVLLSALLGACAPASPTPNDVSPAPPTDTPTQPPTEPVPSPTVGPSSGWLTYSDATLGFEIQYPPEGQIMDMGDGATRINLPVAPGTNLIEKFFQVNPSADTANCISALGPGPVEQVDVSGVTLNKAVGGEGVAGSVYEYAAYALVNGPTCLNMQFTLHYGDLANYSPPVAEFDRAAETAVFDQMLATFKLTQ